MSNLPSHFFRIARDLSRHRELHIQDIIKLTFCKIPRIIYKSVMFAECSFSQNWVRFYHKTILFTLKKNIYIYI